jgi:hypothetical protein
MRLRKTMGPEDAARGTPTGKMMERVFGFTKAEVIEIDPLVITVIFSK